MNPTRSKSLLLALLVAAFSLTITTGCTSKKKEEQKEVPADNKTKMDTGNVKPIVPPNKATGG